MSLSKLGRYELVRVLGKGAMGLVYEAKDPNLDRRVAIKTIKVENLGSEEAAEYEVRFRTEARSAARLQHPNIVSVYDSDRDGDVAFLVMEFIRGDDLKHHLDRGQRYTLAQAAGIMGDLLSALDYAHQQNIVHRDIKPANLLIEASGRIKLTDFGVARIQDSGESTRTKGTMVGTLKYMSPEQVRGLPIDARSDLFSAGIVLYQLLTGQRPFDGAGDFEIIQKIVNEPALAPSAINPQLPPAIDRLMERVLEKSREARFPTAREFNQALQSAVGAATDPTITPPPKPQGRSGESSTWTSTLLPGESLVSTGSGSMTGVPASAVTQEAELVYWKEIKDSLEIEDFRDFLVRFPSGIYSDLARRRIRRLTHPERAPGGSLSGTGTGTHLPAQDTGEPTLRVQRSLQDGGQLAPAADPSDDNESTRQIPRPELSAPPAGEAISRPALALATPRRSRMLGLAAAALLGVGLLAYLGWSRTDPPAAAAAAPAASRDEAAGKDPKAQTQATKEAQPAATPQKPKGTDARPEPAARTATGTTAGAGTPAKPPPRTASETSSTNKPAAAAASKDPRKECEGRVLFGYLTCMQTQCEKAVYTQHPVCVERREMEKRNREVQ